MKASIIVCFHFVMSDKVSYYTIWTHENKKDFILRFHSFAVTLQANGKIKCFVLLNEISNIYINQICLRTLAID